MNKKRILGVIPARGGSKGIPEKNIYPINGMPLIAYSIKEAQESRLLTDLIVSTDSEKIAKIAKQYHCGTPFLRPSNLSTDKALSVDVMRHAVQFMEKHLNIIFDYLVLLQPTTPLRKVSDIDSACQLLIDGDCDSVVSLTDVGANHPARMYKIDKDGVIANIMNEGVTMRPRQELPAIYIRSGDVYACERGMVVNKGKMIGSKCKAIIIPEDRSVNIDTFLDLKIAELKMAQLVTKLL